MRNVILDFGLKGLSSIIVSRKKRLQSKNKSASKCHTYLRRTADKVFDFLIARKYGQKGRQVELVFRKLKAQIYWPTTDQKVRGPNSCGRTSNTSTGKLNALIANK